MIISIQTASVLPSSTPIRKIGTVYPGLWLIAIGLQNPYTKSESDMFIDLLEGW